jgi:hypothetical protein
VEPPFAFRKRPQHVHVGGAATPAASLPLRDRGARKSRRARSRMSMDWGLARDYAARDGHTEETRVTEAESGAAGSGDRSSHAEAEAARGAGGMERLMTGRCRTGHKYSQTLISATWLQRIARFRALT